MRSVSPLYSNLIHLPNVLDGHSITTLTVDNDTNKVYAVSEQISGEEVNIKVWAVKEDDSMVRY